MNRFKINFSLRKADEIIPWGETNKSLSWFGLTDGLLWINAGESVIYEYSGDARKFWKYDIKYNEYQLSRFLEDFSELFPCISESVPHELYDNINSFENMTEKWKDLYINKSDGVFNIFYFEEFCPLTEWYFNRTLNSAHLIGGPHISFFRCGNMIKILWDSSYLLENGKSIWTFPNGLCELPYSDFTDEVKEFFSSFYCAMDKQVEYAVSMDWQNVSVDKKHLVSENTDRKQYFNKQIDFLFSENSEKTNFSHVLCLYDKMRSEFNEQKLQEIPRK